MRYMLDTNICIYLLNGPPDSLLARLAEQDYGSVVISCLTLAELQRGSGMHSDERRKNEQLALEVLLSEIVALDFGAAAAQAFGVLGSSFPLKRNQAIDNMIAAHAISENAVLVTNNMKDFKSYPGLKVENWL